MQLLKLFETDILFVDYDADSLSYTPLVVLILMRNFKIIKSQGFEMNNGMAILSSLAMFICIAILTYGHS